MPRSHKRLEKLKEFFQLLSGHRMGLAGLVIIVLFLSAAVFAPFLWTVDPEKSGEIENIMLPPSSQFWLGTDDLARDIWSQTLYGTRVSLTVGFIAALITVITGTLIGLIAGFYGKWIEEVLMRIVDFL